ncbi:MAG: hypothetical protein Q7S08_01735 [bacterium]|nr:hypothetical protein [bacterium]
MSDSLLGALRANGISAHLASYHRRDADTHDFVFFDNRGEDWIADPTWQQFLKKSDSALPHVLLCRKDSLRQELMRLGVSEDLHRIWLEAEEVRY